MHFFSRRNASLALSLAAVGVLAACGDDVTVPIEPPPPVVISITPQAVTLNPQASATLSVQITGGNPTPTLATCATGSSAVATAAVSGNNCTVTAVNPGSTTITATTSAGQSASAAVTVNSLPSALGELTVSPANAALSVGQQVTLVPNANPAPGVTPTYTYTPANPAIATVNAQGVVTAASAGTTTITVTANGSGNGVAAATRTFGVTINVSNAPPAMTALTVSPSSLTIATGGTGQLTSAVTQPAGATAATISYVSSNTAVATVAGSGANATVTAVAPGTATITVTAVAAATATLSQVTLTQLVPVTVAALPVVSIEAVTQGPIVTTGLDSAYSVTSGGDAGGPTGPTQGVIAGIRQALNPQLDQSVDIANTKDQIQVRLNLNTNGANVDSVVVYINPATTAGRRAAARQINPQAGQLVTGYINTADFTPNDANGIGEVFYTNGLKEISASVWTSLPAGATCPVAIIETVVNGETRRNCEIQNAANNRQSFNFNNIDGFALTMTPPANSKLDSNQRTWWGGPTVSDIGLPSGNVSFQVWPVIYTPNRTIDRVSATFGLCRSFGVGGLPNGVEKVGAPYKYTVGTALPAGSTDTFINCANLTGAYDGLDNFRFEDYPMVTYSLDNSQNPGPRSIYAYNPNLGTNVWAGPRPSLYRQSAQVQSPNAIRVDYRGPTLNLDSPSVQERWISTNYAFSQVYSASDQNSGAFSANFPGPVGVGIFPNAQRVRGADGSLGVMTFYLASRNTCAGPQEFTPFGTGLATTSNAIASLVPPLEHPCDFTNDAYSLAATETDLLGNRSTTISGANAAAQIANGELFGVDTAPPTLTLAWDGNGPIPDMPDHYRATGDSIFQAGGAGQATPIAVAQANESDFYFGSRYRDTRSGFNITNHGTRTVLRWRPDATPLFSNVAVSENVATRTMSFAGGNGNPLENEDPTFRRDSVTIYGRGPISGGTGSGNTTPSTSLQDSPAVGYYQYDLTIRDRAGNSSSIRQRAVIDNTSPIITGVDQPAVLGATGTAAAVAQTYRPTGTDDIEAFDADMFFRYPAMGMIGDSTVNSQVLAGGARIRFRRNLYTNWHNPWDVFTDGLLSTPFGPGAALSGNGLTNPIPSIRGIEATDSTDAPIVWSQATRDFVGFKPNLLGVYAYDVRASKTGAWLAPYAGDPPYRNHGMTNMFAGVLNGDALGESAYVDDIFPLNVSNGTRWHTKDFGTPASGFQGLVSWAGFSHTASTINFRATTNSVSTQPIFPTVYLFRWEGNAQHTGSGYDSTGTTLNDSVPGQWVFIAELQSNAPSNPSLFDQGSQRVWNYQYTVASVTNGRIIQAGTNTAGCFRAVGVDMSGDGIATRPYANGGTCPTFAAVAGTNNATVTRRAYGPGTGTIVHIAGNPVVVDLIKSSTNNEIVRLSANLDQTVQQVFRITPTFTSVQSTLQTAPTGCSVISVAGSGNPGTPVTYPTTGAVDCYVNAGFGSRHVSAIFDRPSIP